MSANRWCRLIAGGAASARLMSTSLLTGLLTAGLATQLPRRSLSIDVRVENFDICHAPIKRCFNPGRRAPSSETRPAALPLIYRKKSARGNTTLSATGRSPTRANKTKSQRGDSPIVGESTQEAVIRPPAGERLRDFFRHIQEREGRASRKRAGMARLSGSSSGLDVQRGLGCTGVLRRVCQSSDRSLERVRFLLRA